MNWSFGLDGDLDRLGTKEASALAICQLASDKAEALSRTPLSSLFSIFSLLNHDASQNLILLINSH